MNHYLVLLLGLVCAGVGGELFIRGAVGLARWARISAGIIGATVAAFATSSPELAVALTATVQGTGAISVGNALGSNVLNVALILGLTLLLGNIRATRAELRREYPFALLVPVIVGLLAFDGRLSRIDGVLLLSIFFIWLFIVIIEVRRQRSAAEKVLGEPRRWLALVLSLSGLVILIAAGRFIISGAESIAISLGWGEFIVGAVIVSIGTTLPEMATSLIAKIRGHEEVAIGTILGSNIFNGLFIIGLVALIEPLALTWGTIFLSLAFGFVSTALVLPSTSGIIERWRGFILLAFYITYLALTLAQA